jgi:hypothetical protein
MADSAPDQHGSSFWAVDVPGLNREQANWVVSVLADGPYALHGIPVNPEEFFTVRVDREGAEVLREALHRLSANEVAVALSEIVDEWLDSAGE